MLQVWAHIRDKWHTSWAMWSGRLWICEWSVRFWALSRFYPWICLLSVAVLVYLCTHSSRWDYSADIIIYAHTVFQYSALGYLQGHWGKEYMTNKSSGQVQSPGQWAAVTSTFWYASGTWITYRPHLQALDKYHQCCFKNIPGQVSKPTLLPSPRPTSRALRLWLCTLPLCAGHLLYMPHTRLLIQTKQAFRWED